jgi:chorismate mutase
MNEQQPDIGELRRSLDQVDSGIVGLIAQRTRVIAEIARMKEHGTSAIQDADRERQVLAGVAAQAGELGVSPSLARRFFRELIDDSVSPIFSGRRWQRIQHFENCRRWLRHCHLFISQ